MLQRQNSICFFTWLGRRCLPKPEKLEKWWGRVRGRTQISLRWYNTARRKLFISFAANRRIHGLWQSAIPSRFISELPENDLIEEMARGLSIGRIEPVMIGPAETRVGKPGYGPGWDRMAFRTKNSYDAITGMNNVQVKKTSKLNLL